jgi:hypothetical protein
MLDILSLEVCVKYMLHVIVKKSDALGYQYIYLNMYFTDTGRYLATNMLFIVTYSKLESIDNSYADGCDFFLVGMRILSPISKILSLQGTCRAYL